MRYRWDPVYPAAVCRTGWARRSPPPGIRRRAERGGRQLSRHFAEGRLDQAEFKARLDRAMGATTRGDLDGLFDDLPRLADEPSPPRPGAGVCSPLVVVVILVAVAAGSTVPIIHVPWVLLVVVGLLLWHRRRPAPTTGSAPDIVRTPPVASPPAPPGRTPARAATSDRTTRPAATPFPHREPCPP